MPWRSFLFNRTLRPCLIWSHITSQRRCLFGLVFVPWSGYDHGDSVDWMCGVSWDVGNGTCLPYPSASSPWTRNSHFSSSVEPSSLHPLFVNPFNRMFTSVPLYMHRDAYVFYVANVLSTPITNACWTTLQWQPLAQSDPRLNYGWLSHNCLRVELKIFKSAYDWSFDLYLFLRITEALVWLRGISLFKEGLYICPWEGLFF